MSAQAPENIEVLKGHINRKEWQEAVSLLSTLRAADEAQAFSKLGRSERGELLSRLNDDDLARLLENLEKDDAFRLSREVDGKTLSHALDKVTPRLVAHVLHSLPQARADEVLKGMEDQNRVPPLLDYTNDSAGGLMSPQYVLLIPGMTVSEGISRLRSLRPPSEAIEVLYVGDDEGKLLGRVTLGQLVLADPEAGIGEVMESDVISVRSDADKEECARLMERYGLVALPVVNEERRLVGSIRIIESLEVAEEEATEDMYRMVGLSEHERVFGPMADSIRRRLPWLLINLATVVLAGFVVSLFDSTISRVVMLAAFIPIITGQGGNSAAQTGTIMVRSLALGEVSFSNVRTVLFKEVGLAAINGLVIALVAGAIAIAFVWQEDLWPAAVLAVAMFLTMIVAGLSGALVPLVLKLVRIDPALASTVVITTITDISGLLFLLGAAALTVHYWL